MATPAGPRPIGEILTGESVLAYNFKQGEWVERRVETRHENIYEGPVLTLTTESGTIRTMVYHPFWVERGRDLGERSVPRELSPVEDQGFSLEGRWVNSHELRVGDILIGQDGSRRALLRIEQEFKSAFPVNNLTIDEDHTFAVGPDGVLVHNTDGCGASKSGLGGATRLSADELATGQRLEAQLGITLKESAHLGADYVDDLGRSYDALGGFDPKFWNEKSFLRQIDKHLRKSNDFTVIDLTGFSQTAIEAVRRHLSTLSSDQLKRIIQIGF